MTTRTAAKRYARAMLDVAVAEADPESAERQLANVVELCTGHAELWKILTNPAVPTPKKRAIALLILHRLDVSPVVCNLVVLLADRDRLRLLPELLDAYRSRLLDYRQVVRADVTTAVPLSDERIRGLGQSLATLTGRKVVMSVATDPALIGGVITRIGSTIYDGSVRRQLAKMQSRLEQSV
jgi:F-type H+-transporting ATPase subunit delta